MQWNGPDRMDTDLQVWDARTGGSWRYVTTDEDGGSYAFHGCFHEVRTDRIVQTFTFDGFPDGVALETITFDRPRRRPHPAAARCRSATASRAAT